MKPVTLAPEAEDELLEAALWYDDREPGLGTDLLDEVERMVPMLGTLPESFPRLLDPDPTLGIRRALLPRFPYALVYRELEDHVRVLAVAHAKRRPGYWLDRIEEAPPPPEPS